MILAMMTRVGSGWSAETGTIYEPCFVAVRAEHIHGVTTAPDAAAGGHIVVFSGADGDEFAVPGIGIGDAVMAWRDALAGKTVAIGIPQSKLLDYGLGGEVEVYCDPEEAG